ncbi:MAG: glycosyltransferase family 2 protein [Bacteroidota bacterium]
MHISIILPLYNAGPYVTRAIRSALQQVEVVEVIVIDDASTDEGYAQVQRVAAEDARVCLLRHPDGQNHGAGATRNLGLTLATAEYVAFLDADDYYLPNRFARTKRVFAERTDTDGVYETIGVDYYDEEGKDKSLRHHRGNLRTGLRATNILPGQLMEYLCTHPGENIHLNGLTLKRQAIQGHWCFDEGLRQAQDTDFIWQLALNIRLYSSGSDMPVARRGVHAHNRVFDLAKVSYYRRQLAKKWYDRMLTANWQPSINWYFTRLYLETAARQRSWTKHKVTSYLFKAGGLLVLWVKHPWRLTKRLLG